MSDLFPCCIRIIWSTTSKRMQTLYSFYKHGISNGIAPRIPMHTVKGGAMRQDTALLKLLHFMRFHGLIELRLLPSAQDGGVASMEGSFSPLALQRCGAKLAKRVLIQNRIQLVSAKSSHQFISVAAITQRPSQSNHLESRAIQKSWSAVAARLRTACSVLRTLSHQQISVPSGTVTAF